MDSEKKRITITEEQLDLADKTNWPVIVLEDGKEYLVVLGKVKGAVVVEYGKKDEEMMCFTTQ